MSVEGTTAGLAQSLPLSGPPPLSASELMQIASAGGFCGSFQPCIDES